MLDRLTGAGHVWLGAPAVLPRVLGCLTTLLAATEIMRAFFSAHQKAD